MKKVAILGCENSHADAFISCIKEKEEFTGIEVIGVYSHDRAASEKLNGKFGVPIMEDPAEAVGKIDGLIITARHGAKHYPYAKPYIESGIPMFIDKPITVSEDEAVEFMRELKAASVRICGGSSLKQDIFVQTLKEEALSEKNGKTVGGYIRAPYQAENEHGGFYFYAQHLVEMVCEIFGKHPLSVTAKQNGKQIHVLFHYENYDCVGLFCDRNYTYFASLMSEKATASFDIPTTTDWYYKEFGEFYKLLAGEEQTVSYKDFISPVFIMNAIERSLNSGKEEFIEYKE